MSDLVGTLLVGDQAVSVEAWRDFWDRLHARSVSGPEAAAVLASLSTRLPGAEGLASFVGSLAERRHGTATDAPSPGLAHRAVNIVGTGGGPATFNISTAAAFVAAAIGVRVLKTGSRAYSSRCGSLDLLGRLGVPLTSSADETEHMLGRFGLAFAGPYVYPPELVLLARCVFPMDMKRLGRCLNRLGPFLAHVPVSVQLTGLSESPLLAPFRTLAETLNDRRYWFCFNELGADELLSVGPNDLVRCGTGDPERIEPATLGFAPGTLEDLRPAPDDEAIVPHFLDILSGDGPPVAVDTVCLNAAALALAGGVAATWDEGVVKAREAVGSGRSRRLVESIRTAEKTRLAG
ncbi:hypothetical protein [uncultured Rhodospira sp.]|uniref:anthranilate phosphoribosyltransferase n=1 Tax=uncultured Rhodospira sp. TaxID=1936189 RepID=UPI00260BD5BD|nr:hypothetical protein [uncultured Rhodospira sp.]